MKFVAQLTLVDGSKILLPLKCREYHANKLQYVFCRTLDRSIFKDAIVFFVEEIDAPSFKLIPAEVKNV